MLPTVVDNRMVERLMADSKIRLAFPTLVEASKATGRKEDNKRCPTKRCGGSPAPSQLRFDHMAVKRAIAALPASQLNELKAAISASKLRIQYVSESGETNLII